MPYLLMRKALRVPREIELLSYLTVFDSSEFQDPLTYLNQAFLETIRNDSFTYYEDLITALPALAATRTADTEFIAALIEVAKDEVIRPFELFDLHVEYSTPHFAIPSLLHGAIIADDYFACWSQSRPKATPKAPTSPELIEACKIAHLPTLTKLLAEKHSPNGSTSTIKTLIEEGPENGAYERKTKMLAIVLLFLFAEESLYSTTAYNALAIRKPALNSFVKMMKNLLQNQAFNRDDYITF